MPVSKALCHGTNTDQSITTSRLEIDAHMGKVEWQGSELIPSRETRGDLLSADQDPSTRRVRDKSSPGHRETKAHHFVLEQQVTSLTPQSLNGKSNCIRESKAGAWRPTALS